MHDPAVDIMMSFMANRRIYCAMGYECNNKCLFCAVDSEANQPRRLSNIEIARFLDRLKGMKNIEVEFSGGEPTCRPEFFYFLEQFYQRYPHIKYILLSNGRMFSNLALAEKLADLEPYSVIIPIHGDTPQLHDAITQATGSFSETLQGIHNLYEYGVNAGIKTIVNKLNYEKMPEIIELIAQKYPKCPGIIINGLEIQGRALINKELIGIRLRETIPSIEKAIDSAGRYGIDVKVYSIPPCMFGEDYRKFAAMKLRSTVISKTPKANMCEIPLTYGTIKKCSGCSAERTCTGCWHSYFKAYGTDEIMPI